MESDRRHTYLFLRNWNLEWLKKHYRILVCLSMMKIKFDWSILNVLVIRRNYVMNAKISLIVRTISALSHRSVFSFRCIGIQEDCRYIDWENGKLFQTSRSGTIEIHRCKEYVEIRGQIPGIRKATITIIDQRENDRTRSVVTWMNSLVDLFSFSSRLRTEFESLQKTEREQSEKMEQLSLKA